MKDKRLTPKGWPESARSRRANKMGEWHNDWYERYEHLAEFRPEGRKEPSDYNQHYLDVNPPPKAEDDFDRRSLEITGQHHGTRALLPEPDPYERFAGAVVSAGASDALGYAVKTGAVRELVWQPSMDLRRENALTEYVRQGDVAHVTAVTQMVVFTLEGLIRAHVARRKDPRDVSPLTEVRNAYRRWYYTQFKRWGEHIVWRSRNTQPPPEELTADGWLIAKSSLYYKRDEEAAAPNVASYHYWFGEWPDLWYTYRDRAPRGGSVVSWAAMAAIWSNSASEVFATAVEIATITHVYPDDYLPAGFLAVVLHQQLRGEPFFECLVRARNELERWTGHEKTRRLIKLSVKLVRKEWAPANVGRVREAFGNGMDGAEVLACALYVSMCSDYVREAILLSMNYSDERSAVGAISGLVIGAEYGIHAVPRDLRESLDLNDVLETLARDTMAEFSPEPPTDPHWMQRYPGW